MTAMSPLFYCATTDAYSIHASIYQKFLWNRAPSSSRQGPLVRGQDLDTFSIVWLQSQRYTYTVKKSWGQKNCRAITWWRWSYFIFCPIPCFWSLLRSRQHSLVFNFNSFYITDRGVNPYQRVDTLVQYFSKGSKEKKEYQGKFSSHFI